LNAITGSQRPLKLIFTAYKWIVVAPILAFSTILLGFLIIVLSTLGAPNLASRVFARAWARFNSAVSMMSVAHKGQENLDSSRSYVIVSNHQSLYDIYVLYGFLGVDFKWVMKGELRSVPVLGAACAAMGHIMIDRSNTKAALDSINSAQSRIVDGMSVVFFPEGTRSRDGELNPFKKGAFRFALEMGLPILPVVIHGTKDILPSDTIDLMPGQATIEVLPAIETIGLDVEALGDLSDKIHDQMALALSQTS
jgi:1-acyl-sn-glycerol-3-phosphate acyltransferase